MHGFFRKKLGRVALQRSEQARDQFRSTISLYKPPVSSLMRLALIGETLCVDLGIAYEANQRRPTSY